MELNKQLIQGGLLWMLLILSASIFANDMDAVNQAVRVKDFKKAFVICRGLADDNDKIAQYKLATFYRNGLGVKQNNRRAYQWYLRSAEQGYVKSQYQVGKMLQHGLGVSKDLRLARVWYEKAASKNDRRASKALTTLDKQPDVGRSGKAHAAIFEAVKKGKIRQLKALLAKGTKINVLDENANGLLHLAVKHRQTAVADVLMDSNINVNNRNQRGMTPLMLAVIDNNAVLVRKLVESGARLELKNKNKETAHQLAINYRHTELSQYLQSQSSNPIPVRNLSAEKKQRIMQQSILLKQGPYKGWTPLMVAAWTGDETSFKRLLNNRIDANLADTEGYSVLMRAAWKGRLEMVKSLMDMHADINRQSRLGMTALMLAAREGHEEVVDLLIARGANVGLKDHLGNTALMFSARKGYAGLVKALCRVDAEHVNLRRKDSQTVLIIAASQGRQHVVDELLKCGADPLLQDKQKQNALWYALLSGHHTTARLLLSVEMLEGLNVQGNTLLSTLASRGDVGSFKLLGEVGVNLNQQTRSGNTALIIAAKGGSDKLVDFLLANKADANQKNKYGNTALMQAAQAGHGKIVKKLIAAGANSSIRNNNKHTASELAQQAGHKDIADYIHSQDKKKWLGIF